MCSYQFDCYFLLSFNSKFKFHVIDNPAFTTSTCALCLIGSCNGLLCLIDRRNEPHAPILWNPATREFRRLPMAPDKYKDRMFSHFGFGFSPIINDCKIVRFLLNNQDKVICKVKMFSLRIGEWRDIEFDNIKEVCFGYKDYVNFDVVSADGVMFFRGSKSKMHAVTESVIVSFDFATEVFTVIQWHASFYSYTMES